MCQQETKERFDLGEKWEKEKRNLAEEHKKNMNKLQQEMEAEKNNLQKELDQMVCFTLWSVTSGRSREGLDPPLVTTDSSFLISNNSNGRVLRALGLKSSGT